VPHIRLIFFYGALWPRGFLPPLRIVVVDDNEEIRHVVAAILHQHHGWELVGEASDGMMAVEIVNTLQPDIVIMRY
jgi:chemotaxis response regulator CheB